MKLGSVGLTLLVTAAVLIGVASSLLLGAGRTVDWLPASHPHEQPPAAKPVSLAALPENTLALTWQQSMFSPDRQPDAATGKSQATSLAGIRLSGVIIDGQAQWALLRLANQRTLKLAVGSTLDNGWTLTGVTPQTATFLHQGQSQQLSLPVLRLPPPSKAPAITLPNVTTP
ncbi:MAG: putative ral secretion pathway protein GspN [Pseudomonas sp.]|jgi:general secretion pathway protein N|nr:putative ral secretion pathway protein GspN [Pseudomonas sp.]